MNDDIARMNRAIELAAAAESAGDVPIGCVLVLGETIVETHNEKETRADPTAHAEMLAIREAARHHGAWRLIDATLYVTKEPCTMCAGAIVAARVRRVVYGCPDPKGGAAGSVIDVFGSEAVNHRVEVEGGVLAAQASAQLRAFFAKRRGRAGDEAPGPAGEPVL
jgi:tRNA(adenine34) deaminase